MAGKRPIVVLPREKDGLFIEPDEPDWVMMAHNQERAIKHFNYADTLCGDSNSYDTEGDYNCGRCNMANGTACLLVDIDAINRTAGSCEDWESIRSGDPELFLKRKDDEVANYGVAANGKGFGCARCPYSSHAKNTDSQGRNLWCGELAFYIQPTGCCTANGAALVADGSPDEDYDADEAAATARQTLAGYTTRSMTNETPKRKRTLAESGEG